MLIMWGVLVSILYLFSLHLGWLILFIFYLQPNTVAYEEGSKVDLKKALVLGDALSDLPRVCRTWLSQPMICLISYKCFA